LGTTQKQKNEQITHDSKRTEKMELFDSLADEFNRTTIEEKFLTLASLNYYGLFEKTIKD